MLSRTYSIMASDVNGAYPAFRHQSSWDHSPRVNGRLVLRANPMSRLNRSVQKAYTGNVSYAPSVNTDMPWATSDFQAEMDRLYASAYSRLISKLKAEDAGLGITLASWDQTWNMLGSRAKMVRALATRALATHNPRGRVGVRGVRAGSSADNFLEYQFGWLPLFTSAHSAMRSFTEEFPSGFVTGRAKDVVSRKGATSSTDRSELTGTIRCVVNAQVSVSNPNLWLLNRLGLINPLVVAWDLVPWSFVVNWFVNVNAVLGSVTDTVGLSVSNITVTKGHNLVASRWRANGYPTSHPFFGTSFGRYTLNNKSREVLPNFPPPRLMMRLPGVSMTGSLIQLSLAYQQVARLRG